LAYTDGVEPATTLEPTIRASPAALLREPLAWAALTAFVGSAVGLAGTFAWASWEGSLGAYEPLGPTPSPPLLASWGGPVGGLLAALSLLGVAPLLGRGSWAAWVGVMLLLVWLAASLSFALYSSLRPPEPNLTGAPPFAFLVLVHASFWLGSAAVLPLALGALFVAGKRRLGVVLLVLSVPGMLPVFLYVPPVGADISLSEITALIGPLSFPGAGVGVPEAILWVSLGVLLLREARLRALSKLWQSVTRENEQKARRLYEEGLGSGDLTVVDALVAEDFRDLKRGSRGKLGMERFITDLWASYPDLSVSVEGQEAEGDLVRTRLFLSGTDRGSGVMWFPPTGRRVGFKAEFVDRFRGGKLVEHAGEADTEELLRQLGHHE
jgi:predicted ester cyclase